MGVRGALAILVLAHDRFSVLPALNDFNYSSGNIGSNVVADEDVGRFCVVEGQRISVMRVDGIRILRRVPVLDFQFSDGHTLRARVCA